MRSILRTTTAVLSLLITNTQCTSGSNQTDPLPSRIIFPISFTPPQVFQNVNLLRNINLEKAYARETINVVIENVDAQPQDQYFLPFAGDIIGKVGGLEVRDKKEPDKGLIDAELVEYDPSRYYHPESIASCQLIILLNISLAPRNSIVYVSLSRSQSPLNSRSP